ncbi:MAG: 6-phosphofructokinase, partial [Halanaerobiales bacterium]
DNDLVGTDRTFGFDTAVSIATEAIDRIHTTAQSHHRVMIIETMGRETGFLTLMTGLAGGAESILIPEINVSIEDVCNKILQGYERGKLHSIILVAEGIGGDFETNRDVSESKATLIGHEINKRTGLETRVIILGHLQRGGRPTAMDRIVASRMGAKAVELLINGESNKMISMLENKITYCEIEQALQSEINIDFDIYNLSHILSL